MYEFLNGRLVEKTPASAVIETGGVGYYLQIPVSTFSALPETGQTVRLWTHFVVREDAHALYGFSTEEERRLFRLLITISGIGPKSAATVLSGIPLADFRRAVIDGDLAVLTAISGIGRKTAERIVIELREKFVVEEKTTGTVKLTGDKALFEDSLRALIELGYKKQNAQTAVEKAAKQLDRGYTLSDLVRASLKYVS